MGPGFVSRAMRWTDRLVGWMVVPLGVFPSLRSLAQRLQGDIRYRMHIIQARPQTKGLTQKSFLP